MEPIDAFRSAMESSISVDGDLFLESTSEFNDCLDHIVQLINDSVVLYESGSYSTSVFLSISVIEEIGKTEIACYRFIIPGVKEKIRRDPLKDHETKEILGSRSGTIAMGSRLNKAIGDNQINEIMQLSCSGGLKRMRESSLYWDRVDGKIKIPEDRFDKEFARALLLYAIESFDDALIGYTEYSFQIDNETDLLFERVADN